LTGNDLLTLFGAVFHLLHAVDPAAFAGGQLVRLSGQQAGARGGGAVSASPDTLAIAIAALALSDCGSLPLEGTRANLESIPTVTVDTASFRAWYLLHFDVGVAASSAPPHRPAHPPSEADGAPQRHVRSLTDHPDAEVAALAADPAIGDLTWCGPHEVARLLHLTTTPVAALLEMFAIVADEEGQLTRAAFDAVFAALATKADRDAADASGRDVNVFAFTPIERKRARFVRGILFDAFDTNYDGVVDAPELVAGLTVLAAGSREEKIRAAFLALDVNQDGEAVVRVFPEMPPRAPRKPPSTTPTCRVSSIHCLAASSSRFVCVCVGGGGAGRVGVAAVTQYIPFPQAACPWRS